MYDWNIESTKRITSSRSQGLGSGLCDFAQIVPFSCPFEVGLWLCCVRFSSAISHSVSWPCAECGVAHLPWSIQNVTISFKHTSGNRLTAIELQRKQLCLQYICKLRSNPCNPVTLPSIVCLALVSDACLRLDKYHLHTWYQIESNHSWLRNQPQ